MKIIHHEKQKDNIAKLLYDFCKIIFAVAVVGPTVQPGKINFDLFILGSIISFIFLIFAYLIDKHKIE